MQAATNQLKSFAFLSPQGLNLSLVRGCMRSKHLAHTQIAARRIEFRTELDREKALIQTPDDWKGPINHAIQRTLAPREFQAAITRRTQIRSVAGLPRYILVLGALASESVIVSSYSRLVMRTRTPGFKLSPARNSRNFGSFS